MEPPVARAGGPARRLQDLLDLLAGNGGVGERAHHAARADGLQHGGAHPAPPPTRLTRCSPTAWHTASSSVLYLAGSTERSAASGSARSGPVRSCCVSGEARPVMKSARRPAAVSRRSGPYSAASSS